MLEPYLSWNSGHLYREPRKRHKRGANSPYGRREVHRSGRGRGGGAGQGHDLLDRQRSFSRCSGLLMPISRWISVSNRAGTMTPLFTLARKQPRTRLASRLRTGTGDRRQEVMRGCGGTDTRGPGRGCGCGWGWGGAYIPPARPQQLARPTVGRHALSPGFLQQLMPTSNETFKIQESLLHTGIKQVNLSIYSLYKFAKVK